MSMKENAISYLTEHKRNCAESMLLGYNNQLSSDTIKALGAFGGGMGCKKICGALCGGVAALGITFIEETAHGSPQIKIIAAEYTFEFEKRFGGVDCSVLKPLHHVEGLRCASLVGAAAELLEEILVKYR